MMKNKNSRTALKFQRYKIEKTQQNMSSEFITFRTHTLSKSEAEIILPPHYYNNVSNINEDYIYCITSGKISFYAEISESTIDKNLKEASILQNLVSIAGIVLDSSGTFKGQMKGIQKQKIPKTYELQYAQILVKNMYLSRRDQYKVLKTLKDRTIHVYNRKNLYFDKLKLEVTNLMYNNQEIGRTGVITKNTKIIFRSGCAKYTILVELSEEMFELNENKELYLEKTIHFLQVFFQRNSYFNNKHRIEIILFARLFYPQFNSLNQAYESLQTDENHGKGNVFTINYAVALQKDYQGRIYQDVYRRLLWPSGTVSGFRQQFWERVSQFIFTINWADSQTYAKNISQSVEQNVEREIFLRKTQELAFKIKPFLHRLPCKLAKSKQTCFFEAISMISQQYKHHYYFRSLSETGNAITVVSAGKSIYTVDTTTYKMAKSNVYLTNINLIHINLRRRQPKIQVEIINMQKKPRYQNKEDIIKLQHLLDWCIEEDAYKSPTNMNIEFSDDFELKSAIFPQKLRVMTEDEKRSFQYVHYCTKSVHYINEEEEKEKKLSFTVKHKTIEWISAYYINARSYQVHHFFYDNSNFDTDILKTSKKNKEQQTQFTTFQRDLKVIINMKKKYNFSHLTQQSLQAKKLNSYISQAARMVNENKASSEQEPPKIFQDLDNLYQMKFMNKFFQISCLVGDEQKESNYRRMLSNQNAGERDQVTSFTSSITLFSSFEGLRNRRKVSDNFESQLEQSLEKSKEKKKNSLDGTINIFDETYKKKQYTPKPNLYRLDHKRNTHNKQRLKKNYRESNIHFMTTFYNESSIDYLNEFIRRPEPRTEDEKFIFENFYIQREWKNIIFPLLTPIYTNYKANLQSDRMNSKYSNFGEMGVQEQICKHLMENFQIQSENLNLSITMSRGHVHLLLSITAKDNISLFEAVNLEKQKQIVPNLLYRYLCYEEKDYRFGSKSLIFSDENFYNKQDKKQQKKSVKLVMLHESIKGDISCFKDFIQMMGQKYKNIKFDIFLKQPERQIFQVTINLVEDLKNKIYKSQKIDVIFDTSYNPDNLYQIIVQWHYCCATYVNDFIENVISVARKNKIITYLVSKNNAFNTRWTTTTIGEIIFQSRFAMEILEENIVAKKEWLWDREGYYMDRNGQAFIRFNKEKYLIEWYDNTIDKTKWKKLQAQNRFYETFFMKAAAYDFLGGIIDSFTNNNSRKSSLALST